MSELDSINGETQLLALFGGRLSHSPSPATHTRWAVGCGLNVHYNALETETEEQFLALVESMMGSRHFLGGNITNPFKSAALHLQDLHVDEPARRCGAANTLYRRIENGKPGWSLTNTDLFGCSESLRKILEVPGQSTVQVAVVILGRGAMTRTCLVALDEVSRALNLTPSVFVVCRRPQENANKTYRTTANQTFSVQTLNLEDADWTKRLQDLTSTPTRIVCINTLPSGTSQEAELVTRSALSALDGASPWTEKHLFCMTYGTQSWHGFATSMGWSVLNGDLLFECQARASFKLWTGRVAPNLPTALQRSEG